MTQQTSKSIAIALAVAWLGLSAAPPVGAAADTSAKSTESNLEEIVVTAQRRTESIEKVPAAVQAISGAELTREGIENLAQSIQVIPSATTASTIGPGSTVFQIRGVAAGETDGDATVGYYLDNFAFTMPGRPYAPVADFYDMQRVEVLRGPSGTLYGLGSLGGTIKVLTNDPNLTATHASVKVTGGSTEHANSDYSGDLMVNMPIISDKLAFRAVVSYRHLSGYAYIIPYKQPNGNPVDSFTGRFKLLAKINDDFTAQLSYWHNKVQTKFSDRITYADSAQYGGPAVDQTFGEAPSMYNLVALDLAYNLSFATLQSTSGYMDNRVISNNGGFIPGIGRFVSIWQLLTRNVNEDLRIVSNGSGPFRYIGGLFYEHASTKGGQSVSLPDFALPNLGGDSGFATDNYNNLDSKSWAVYGEGAYSAFDGFLDATVGGRFYKEKRVFAQNSAFVLYYPGAPDVVVPTVGTDNADHNTFNPRVNIAIHPTADGMVFVEAAKGFRSGAITSSAIIAGANATLGTHLSNSSPPDTLWNYEIGTKWQLFDRMLAVELIGYYFDWKNAQLELSPTLQTIVVPTGNVKAHGADLSLDWRVFDTGLAMKFTGNINSTTVHDVPAQLEASPALTPQLNNGNQLPGTAKSSFTFVPSYTHSLAGTGYDLAVTGRYSARARQQSIFTGGAYSPYVGLTSLRIGISNSRFDFGVYGDNLSNARGPLDRPGGQNQIPYPRTVGISVEAKM